MGCDIHFHSEVKIGGVWHHYEHRQIDRNYDLFAKMAGVRNERSIEPISMPKGFPEDATIVSVVHKNYWEDDGHSHSWLSAEEIKELYAWIKKHWGKHAIETYQEFGYLFGIHWKEFQANDPQVLNNLEDIRFVFFFDN